MKLNFLDTILRSSVRFILPYDCPEETINYHYLILRSNIIVNTNKIKNKLKKSINKLTIKTKKKC
jgi:hypothetical protein